MSSDRDRIRSLVRNVLAQSLPDADKAESTASSQTSSRFIDIVPQTSSSDVVTRDESSKLVITEDDVRGLERGAVLRIGEQSRLTPLADDVIREKGIEVVRRVSRRGSKTSRMIAVGADHGGFKMKEELKAFLVESGHRVHDFGTNSGDAVDYPTSLMPLREFAMETADVGIMIDGAGVGSAIMRINSGVRAAAVTRLLLRAITRTQ